MLPPRETRHAQLQSSDSITTDHEMPSGAAFRGGMPRTQNMSARRHKEAGRLQLDLKLKTDRRPEYRPDVSACSFFREIKGMRKSSGLIEGEIRGGR